MSQTRFYRVWRSMLDRCERKTCKEYRWYGAKGIKVAERWRIFEDFKADMYKSYLKHSKLYSEKNTTIDRINNLKGYTKENCRWATKEEQGTNTSNSILVTYLGKTLSISGWAKNLGVNYMKLYKRLRTRKWPVEKAFTT